MTHLANHQNLYPVGKRFGIRTVVRNGIKRSRHIFIELKCDCGNVATVRPSEARESCHGCKKKKHGEAFPNAMEFKRTKLKQANGKLVPIDVVRMDNATGYNVVFYCVCRPRTKYVMAYQKWHIRKHLHCHHCAAVSGQYIPPCKLYK